MRLDEDLVAKAREVDLDLRETFEEALREKLSNPSEIKARLAAIDARRGREERLLESAVDREERRRLANLSRPLIERFDDRFGRKVRHNRSIEQLDLDQFIRDERAEAFFAERRITLKQFELVLRSQYGIVAR